MGPIYSLDDLIDMVRRRARLMLLVIAMGCVFSLLFALSQRHIYQSTEVLQITRISNADDLARATSDVPQAVGLQMNIHRLMTRDTMLEIIDAYNLFAEFPDLGPDELLDRLRKAVRIKIGTGGHQGLGDHRTNAVLSITVRMPVAFQAQLVVRDLSRRMIALNKSTRIGLSREVLEFLVARESRLRDEIGATESQIALLRKEQDQALPDSVEPRQSGNARRSEILASQLAQLHKELRLTSNRRTKARMALGMERETLAERLEIIEPATVADLPVTGSRKRFAIIGGALSVALAFFLALVQELRHPTLRTGAQMQRETGILPMVSIPNLDSQPRKVTLWRRFRTWLDGPEPNGRSIT